MSWDELEFTSCSRGASYDSAEQQEDNGGSSPSLPDVVDEDGGRRRRLQWEAERARCVAAETLRIENFVVRHCLPSALRDAERCCENDAAALAPGAPRRARGGEGGPAAISPHQEALLQCPP